MQNNEVKAEHSRLTQCERILVYIEKYGEIDQFRAFIDLGIMRLASRISELRKQGIDIVVKQKTVKNRYDEKCSVAVYSLGVKNGI